MKPCSIQQKKKYYDQSFTGVRNHWKIIFKNKKNIILIYFRMKNTLKNNHNYTLKKQVRIMIRERKRIDQNPWTEKNNINKKVRANLFLLDVIS
jgi:hypothetical protein